MGTGRAGDSIGADDPGAQTDGKPPGSSREWARAAMTERIVAAARTQVARVGAAQLSTRAVARDVGVVSSAVFRYFPNRDALLTELIVRGYGDLGAAVAEREATLDRGDLRGRFAAVFVAARDWALERPHEWGLLFGTPVPGYHAPETTLDPATRTLAVLVGVFRDLTAERDAGRAPARLGPDPVVDPKTIASARAFVGPVGEDADVALGLLSWTWMIGVISAELWGHLVGSVDIPAEFYRAGVGFFADSLGLP